MNPDSERLYTSNDLNTSLTNTPTTPMEAYWISKALARLATKTFKQTHANTPHFDYVNLLPGVVIGPDDRLIPSQTNKDISANDVLEGTRAAVLAPALTKEISSPFPYVNVPVHVADVARAHVDAVDAGVVEGDREYILCSSGSGEDVEWDRDVRGVVRRWFPEEVEMGMFPLLGGLGTVKWRVDGGETERVFGWRFRGFEETVKGLVAQWLELGGGRS
ncbi:hypothetical protein BDW59DRAFT_178335 [Aspergillus cavernicola]|uniref:NAD-dependent epimerase/dehydratase domain-containing protein n=1 Tax=Aspergillus cavernicola TaxID=176166 RepID=A0ABR4HC85_9EURO